MSDDLRARIALALLEIDAVGFEPDEPIRFKSGILSPVYVDNRRLAYYPAAWHPVIEGFKAVIEHQFISYDVIAGVAVGGVPHSSALAYLLNSPSVFIRKEAKMYGTRKLVEGGDVNGRRVLLIEDLVTTGGSSLKAVNALREEGAVVMDVLAIVSYGFQEAVQSFAQANVRLHTLTDFSTIVHRAAQMGKLKPNEQAVIADWLNDPYGWTKRRGTE
jgi:orotate phosphoribosyltransferase